MGFGEVGMEFSINAPTRAQSKQTWAQKKKAANVCARANNSTESDSVCAQVLSGQSQIHPELSKATDERLALSVLPPQTHPPPRHLPTGPNANTSITPRHFQAVQMEKLGRQRGENNQTSRNKRTLNVTRVGRWVCTVNGGKDLDF